MGESRTISLSRATKQFAGRPWPALDDVSISIKEGSFFSIIGPSGAGKSTLLRVLAGLVVPDQGHVSLLGEAPAQARVHKHIGWAPQFPALLPWRSVRENVQLPLQVNRKEGDDPGVADELLGRLGLGDALGLLPSQLSGGMRQRVALARAFVTRPRVLLMDEPFGALDEMTRESAALLLLELWQSERPTVVFVTHSVPEAVLLSDQVCVMARGKLGQVIDVGLARPRQAGTEDTGPFHDLTKRLRSQLRTAVGAAPS